jgi:Uma2 family endonuclease
MSKEFKSQMLFPLPDKPQFPKMTYQEFLKRVPDDVHAEWVDGEVVPMTPVSRKHQEIARFLLTLITHFAEAHELGSVFYEPFHMKPGRLLPGRSPDILFLAKKNFSRLKENYIDGPADLVIEIISPGGRFRDRREKFKEYQLGGVQEYWILDPERERAEFFWLDEGGRFQPLARTSKDVVRSRVMPGLWIDANWLWQKPQPPLLNILKKWGLI